MAADYKRIHRLLKIYTFIQNENGWTAARLAEELKVTERTIFRDIDVLKELGMPVFHDQERKCYKVHKDFYLPSIDLTFDEALALVSLGRQIHDQDHIPFSGAAQRAIAKIRGQIKPAVLRELELIEDHLAIRLAASATQEGFATYYDRVRTAIATGTALRCSYESPARPRDNADAPSDPETFLLKPYTLFFNQRAWYVVGYHGGRDDVRTLKLNRFTLLEPTSHAYEIPRDFSMQKHLGNAWRMIRGTTSYDVELLFDPAFAETISDTTWHATQAFDNLPDGSLRFTCKVDGLDEIVWWALSMGAHCKVIKPLELAQRVQTEAAAMVALYRQPESPALADTAKNAEAATKQ